MPTYVVLIDWTEKGISGYEETVDRYEAAQEAFQQLGVSFQQVYWTLGGHDIVSVVDAPDDQSIAAALLQLGSQGNIRTKTMRAFSREEMREVIEKTG
jgi:uncharacterized protein with GYD domain